jgi:hypothetical protein
LIFNALGECALEQYLDRVRWLLFRWLGDGAEQVNLDASRIAQVFLLIMAEVSACVKAAAVQIASSTPPLPGTARGSGDEQSPLPGWNLAVTTGGRRFTMRPVSVTEYRSLCQMLGSGASESQAKCRTLIASWLGDGADQIPLNSVVVCLIMGAVVRHIRSLLNDAAAPPASLWRRLKSWVRGLFGGGSVGI